jgi:hypothetical protein
MGLVTANAESTSAREVVKRPEIFMPPPPSYLTRFYGNVDYAREVFQTKSIALVHVSQMNDPFDPYFEFVNIFGSRYGAILKWISGARGPKEARWFKDEMPYNSWIHAVRDILKKNADLRASLFLFCASASSGDREPSQNLYMWGHYCAGHRGVAIEFDAERVALSLIDHQTRINPKWSKELRVWAPVLYRDRIEKLAPGDFYDFFKARAAGEELETKLAAQLNTVSRTKSTVWQPEQEWRLMWRNDEPEPIVYKVPILSASIHRVFIGLRVVDDVAARIAAECRAAFPEAEILKGEARPGEFALDFRPVQPSPMVG